MGWLIVLRGPVGSGKTAIQKYLIDRLNAQKSDSAHYLWLDETLEGNFDQCLLSSLKYENVIAEMYYGNSHTDMPDGWLTFFRKKGYNMLSVQLLCSMKTCKERVQKRIQSAPQNLGLGHCVDPGNRPVPNVESNYKFFYDNLATRFPINSGIEEILIDTESKSVGEIGDEIIVKISPK